MAKLVAVLPLLAQSEVQRYCSCFPHELGNIDAIAEQVAGPIIAHWPRRHRMWRCSSAAAPTASVALTDAVRTIFFSNIKDIAGMDENLREDLVSVGQGSVGCLLRCDLGGGAA